MGAGRRTAVAVIAALAATTVAACGSADHGAVEGRAVGGGATTVEQTTGTDPAPESGDAHAPADRGGAPSGDDRTGSADRGGSGVQVGGPIPASAREVNTVKPQVDGVAVFQTPSHNIGCAIWTDGLECRISSYNDDVPYGYDPIGGAIDKVTVSGGVSEMAYHGSDVPAWYVGAFGTDDTIVAETVDYGEVVYYRQYVCLSEEQGLTCWDSETGAGAFMAREETVLF